MNWVFGAGLILLALAAAADFLGGRVMRPAPCTCSARPELAAWPRPAGSR